jgi:hypothetical protein
VAVAWLELPPGIRDDVEKLLGSRVIRATAPTTSFGSEHAAVLALADGSSAFVKSTRLTSTSLADYQVELAVGKALPDTVRTPRFRGHCRRDGWLLLCFDARDGRHPTQPWSPADIARVAGAIEARLPQLTPNPIPGLRCVEDLMSPGRRFDIWPDLLAERPSHISIDDLPTWVAANIPRLAEWSTGWRLAVRGTTALHFDPRNDNYLMDADGEAWVLDWNRACVGAAWVDLVTMLAGGAGDSTRAVALFGEFDAFHPHDDALTSYLAAVAGHWIAAGASPGPTSLRRYQSNAGEVAIGWLRSIHSL